MRHRARRRNLVIWSSSVGTLDKHDATRPTRRGRTRRIHRLVRTGALLAVFGLMRLAHVYRPRWRLLLAGVVLTVVGLALHSGAWGTLVLLGFRFLVSGVVVRPSTNADLAHHRVTRLHHRPDCPSKPG
jgi:hypothetical protein